MDNFGMIYGRLSAIANSGCDQMPPKTERNFHGMIDRSLLRFVWDKVDFEFVFRIPQIGGGRHYSVANRQEHRRKFDAAGGTEQVADCSFNA